MFQRLLSLVLIFLSFVLPATAQQVDSALTIYAERFTPEKLHLHLDRNTYSADETIYYKAYLQQDHDPSSLSKTLYVDFYDDAGVLIKQTFAPLFQSTAKGSFTIPQAYVGNMLHIKAYTKWMLNFDTAFIYSRDIHIHHPSDEPTKNTKTQKQVSASVNVSLYPEGGFSIEGLVNRIAFAAIDHYGNPVSIKGVLKANDKIVDSVFSIHDGMGVFSLLPEKGIVYSFEWKDEKGNTGITPVIIGKGSGVNMQINPGKKKVLLTVQRTADAGKLFETLHLLVHKGELMRYKVDLNLSEKTSIAFNVATNDFYTGIVQFTLFNSDWIPVAERVVFVNNQNHFFEPQLNVVKKDISPKGKNEIEIFVADTSFANMSVAVVDEEFSNSKDEPTIFSDFLISGEIKGKVNNPSYYFSTNNGDIDTITDNNKAAHLDLVMLTHGHRRFDWEKITKGILPTILYPADADYVQINGRLTNQKLMRGKDSVSVNVMVQGKDGSKTVLIIPIGKDGMFKQKISFYYDTVKLFYSLNGKKSYTGESYLQFENNAMTSDDKIKYFKNQLFVKNSDTYTAVIVTDNSKDKPANNFLEEQERIKKLTSFKTLKEVVVSSRVKTKMQVLDDFYTGGGIFGGDGGNYKVDVEGDVHALGFNNIFIICNLKYQD